VTREKATAVWSLTAELPRVASLLKGDLQKVIKGEFSSWGEKKDVPSGSGKYGRHRHPSAASDTVRVC